MTVLKILQVVLTIVLVLLVRKLIWCLRCLWCHYHGRELPKPLTFLPQQSGRVFDAHLPGQEPLKDEEKKP